MALFAGICCSKDGGSRLLSKFGTHRSMSSYSRTLAWKTWYSCVKFFWKIRTYLESVITWASTRRRLIRAMEESRACCWRLATLPPSWSLGGDGCGQSVLLSPSDKAKEVEICSFSETSAWIAATHNTFSLSTVQWGTKIQLLSTCAITAYITTALHFAFVLMGRGATSQRWRTEISTTATRA